MFNNGATPEPLDEDHRSHQFGIKSLDIWSLILDDHKTADPVGSMYAVIVSCESLRNPFTYTALSHLDIFAADI